MASPDQPPTVRVSQLTDLVAIIPFLLGFHPELSLVLLGASDQDGLRTAAGLDLPESAEPPARWLADVEQTAALFTSHGVASALLAGYGPASRVEPATRATTRLLRRHGVPVREAMRVTDGRLWHLTCQDPACCPPQGTVLDATGSHAAASAVYAGLVALPNRDALVATLAPVTGTARDRMAAATAVACTVLTDLVAAAHHAAGSPGDQQDSAVGQVLLAAAMTCLTRAHGSYQARQPVDDEHAATLSVLLQLPSARDAAARKTTGETWQIDMWSDLVRRAEAEFVAAPATLLALAALQAGNGALADIAIRHALRADPDDRLAHLLARVVAVGVAPNAISDMLAD